jgi:hypothetical protein
MSGDNKRAKGEAAVLDGLDKHEASYALGFEAAVEVVRKFERELKSSGPCCYGVLAELLEALAASSRRPPRQRG